MIGQTVSHYRVLEKLGGGGMGVIYKAEDINLGRVVALKFLPEGLDQDPDSLEPFRREARLASSLNHPHICTIYEIAQHDGQYFIAMELLPGQTLSSLIGSKPLENSRVLDLGLQISDALEAAHSAGIIHRDLKPANIFVTDKNQAKILDFGLAVSAPQRRPAAGGDAPTIQDSASQHLTSHGATVGTIAYMSPEQALAEPLDARSDLFSLGVVLYEMTTGTQPFKGATPAAIFNAILNQQPVAVRALNPAIPAKLEEIIDKTLEKKRELRCQSAAELNADLRRLKREIESGTSTRIIAAAPVPARATSLRGLVLVALLAVLIAGALLLRNRLTRSSAPSLAAIKLIQFTTAEGLHGFPTWSPDGRRIAYSREVNGFKKLFIKPLAVEPLP